MLRIEYSLVFEMEWYKILELMGTYNAFEIDFSTNPSDEDILLALIKTLYIFSDNLDNIVSQILLTSYNLNLKFSWMCCDLCYIAVNHDCVQKYRMIYSNICSKRDKLAYLKTLVHAVDEDYYYDDSHNVIYPIRTTKRIYTDNRRKFKYILNIESGGIEICRKFFKYIFGINDYTIRIISMDM